MNNIKIVYCISSNSEVLARTQWVLKRGTEVFTFNDAESALAAISSTTPDLIIVDTSSEDIDVEGLVSATKKDCAGCISYLMLTSKTRRPFSSLFRCNCIVGQASLPIIPDQLQQAVKEGLELSHMCQIRAKLFTTPLPSDRIELVMQA